MADDPELPDALLTVAEDLELLAELVLLTEFAGFEPVLLDTEDEVLRVVTLRLVAAEPAVVL